MSSTVTAEALRNNARGVLDEYVHEFVTIDERQYIRYDDMLVPYSKLQPLSGFDLTKEQWTDGKVYFEFDEAVEAENRGRFIDAAHTWAEVAQLTFIERTNEANYIYITNGNVNSATVGMVGGRQSLIMSNWKNKAIILHEIGHSLGMWHEHQRSDRDQYVDILMGNIEDHQKHNFIARNTTTKSPYDFQSVMHYSSHAFSKNGEMTIRPKAEYKEFAALMGQREYISGGDQLSAAIQYGPKILNIADEAFKAYLVNNFDLNGDGEIDSIESASVNAIHTPGNGEITSIEGIRFFRSLEILDVSNENLSWISAKLPKRLREIGFSNNYLSDILFEWVFPPLLTDIRVSGNPIDVYACENISLITAGEDERSFVFNPIQNGSHLLCDEAANFVLKNGKTRYDRRSKGAKTYHIALPNQIDFLTIETENFEGLEGGEMNLYLAHNRQPSKSDYDFLSTNDGTWWRSLRRVFGMFC